MGMKFDFSDAFTSPYAAVLTGVIVTLKNCLSPVVVFLFAPGNIILMGFINVVFVLGLLRHFCLLGRGRIGDFYASTGAILSIFGLCGIQRHILVANRTLGFYGKAILAYSGNISRFRCFVSMPTNFTFFTYTPCIGFSSGRTCHASGILGSLARSRYGWSWLTAIWTGDFIRLVAIPTNSIICINPTNDTQSVYTSHLDSKIKLPRRLGAVVEAATQKAFGGVDTIIAYIKLNKKRARLDVTASTRDIIARVSYIYNLQCFQDATGLTPTLVSG